ncbi:MAG: M12 family metallopeptidase [Chitinophagaceae bacterium]|nr:M12 family metallopeptidase [Chitinophagaceae bacterium]
MKASFILLSLFVTVISSMQAQVTQQVRAKRVTATQNQFPAKISTSATETNKKSAVLEAINFPNAYTSMKLRLPFASEEKTYLVQKTGHFFILHGDIIVGDDFPKTMAYSTPDFSFISFQWANATMPIVIDPSIYANGMGDIVHAAIANFNSQTELCLVPRTSQDDYVNISFSMNLGTAAGVSKLGRQGGGQPLQLGSSATIGTVMHELMHAAGFYHEQCRTDRDNFIKLHEENMQDDKKNQFQIEVGTAQSTYDYCSIMHYSATAFSKNGNATIECMINGLPVPCPDCLGNRTSFTQKDIDGIDKFYNKVSRFPCNSPFPNPNRQQMQFPGIYPSASQSAMAAFRQKADIAGKEHFAGAFPNFHEAKAGINTVGGTIFIKSTVAVWQDVPLAQLGNPSIDDFAARMRATQNYAVANGYLGGFPTYHHANYGSGIVCGTVLLGPAAADWRDVPIAELGNPPLDDIGARFRSANDYAVRNGYLGGFPTFHHANYGSGIVCGIILIKKTAGEWRDVVIIEGPR